MQKRILWSIAALCATVLLAAGPLEAKGGGGAGGSKGTATAGGAGDIGGGGSADVNADASSTNKDGNGNANGNANGGGNGNNGNSNAKAKANATVTTANKGGRLVAKAKASGEAEAEGNQGNNNAQAGNGTTLNAKAVGGTSKPKGVTTSDTTKVVVRDGKVRVLDGTVVYVDKNGNKLACDGGNCSGGVSTRNGVKVFSFHADEDWDYQGGGLLAATKTAGGVAAWANRNSAGGRAAFSAGAFASGGNSVAGATVGVSAFARVQRGIGPRQTSVTRAAQSKCKSNTFTKDNVQCQMWTR